MVEAGSPYGQEPTAGMIETGSKDPIRSAITRDIITLADQYQSKWDHLSEYSYVSQKYGFKYEARYTKHGELPMIVARARIPLLNVARFEQFRDNYINEM